MSSLDWDSLFKKYNISPGQSKTPTNTSLDWDSLFKKYDIENPNVPKVETPKISFKNNDGKLTLGSIDKALQNKFQNTNVGEKVTRSSNSATKAMLGIDPAKDRVDLGMGTDLDKKITYGEKTTGDKIAEGIGYGIGLGSLGGISYKVGGVALKGIEKLAPKLANPTTKLSKTGRLSLKGGLAGGTFGGIEELQSIQSGEEKSTGERIGDITKEALLWGALDPAVEMLAIPLIKAGYSKLVEPLLKKHSTKQINTTQLKSELEVLSKQTDTKLQSELETLNKQIETEKGKEFLPSNINKQFTQKPLTPTIKETTSKKEILPMAERDYDNVAKRKVNSYQYENPEIKPYIQEEAGYILTDIYNIIKGERFPIKDAEGYTVRYSGVKKLTSETIENIQGITNASYKDIEKALKTIIEDNGKENNALAKRIELIIDDNLTNGYKSFDGYEIPKNDEYVQLKNVIEQSTKIKKPTEQNFTLSYPLVKTQESIVPKLEKQKMDLLNKIENNKILKEEDIVLAKDKKSFNAKDGFTKFREKAVDKQERFTTLSPEIKHLASQTRQTQGTLDEIASKSLVDKNGVNIGESLSELIQKVPIKSEKEFWRYFSHKHNISRAKEGKRVFSQFDSESSAKVVQQILEKNPEFKQTSDDITNWINKFMDSWGEDIIGKETLDLWKTLYPDYIPVNRTSKVLGGAKSSFVNQTNVIKKAKGAREDLTSNINDPKENIAALIAKVVKASRNNDVSLEIVKEVRKGNLTEIFSISSVKSSTIKKEGIESVVDGLTEQFDDIVKQFEKGKDTVIVMEKGQEILLTVKDKNYLKALKSLGEGNMNSAAEQFESIFRKISRPIKDLITGKNPLFGIFNGLRDFQTAFIQGQENNIVKFTTNYMRSLQEIANNSKGFREFVAQGGMQSGFFKSSNLQKTAKKLQNPNISVLEKGIRKVEGFNNLIEATPRYMEYLATLEKGGTRSEAIYNAAEISVNFAKHGEWGKFVDSFVLYLNPALQGIDKFFRQVKSKPLQTTLKSAGIVTAPTILTEQVNKNNPNYQMLDQRTKDDFFLIPNKFGKLDNEGNAETFFRIPKAREYSVIFGTLMNRFGELTRGTSLSDASKGVVGSFERGFSVPVRPVWQPLQDVERNADWKNQPINPLGMTLSGSSNYLKFDETTSELGKILSKMLNEQPIEDIKYTPKDIDYLIDSFTGILGDIILPITTKDKNLIDVPIRKFTTDSLYSNQEITNFYNNLKELRTVTQDQKELTGTNEGTKETYIKKQLEKISDNMSKIYDEIRTTEDDEKIRELRKELIRLAKLGNDIERGGN